MLLTAAAFVATNTVFSPQFHLWLIPLAALVLEGRAKDGGLLPRLAIRAAWVIFVATTIGQRSIRAGIHARAWGLE